MLEIVADAEGAGGMMFAYRESNYERERRIREEREQEEYCEIAASRIERELDQTTIDL